MRLAQMASRKPDSRSPDTGLDERLFRFLSMKSSPNIGTDDLCDAGQGADSGHRYNSRASSDIIV